MRHPSLNKIFIYPVKSLAGIAIESARVTPLGLENDRRWMIVDSQGRFITQRLYPQLSQIKTSIESDQIVLTPLTGEGITLPLTLEVRPTRTVKVWHDQVESMPMSDAENQWVSEYLDIDCQFVYMPDSTVRPIDPEFATSDNDRVSFADGFPFLLISQASLEDLNQRLQHKNLSPVPIERFRPNLLIEGCDAYAEDQWTSFDLSGNRFHGVKPCSRCIMTTIDPVTGTKGVEPFQTLKEYRMRGKKAYFGQNALLDLSYNHSFTLNIGDLVENILL